MKRAWFAITWFALWGSFQIYAVAGVATGTWERPEAFPEEAYNALIYPDFLFILLYFSAAILLLLRHRIGYILGLVAGGGVAYVMIYLLALAEFQGIPNLLADGSFLILNGIAVLQLAKRISS